jgi:hypothetical protein
MYSGQDASWVIVGHLLMPMSWVARSKQPQNLPRQIAAVHAVALALLSARVRASR